MIYKNLDKMLSDWLHEKGFSYGKRRFKMFTFSRLFSKKLEFDKEKKTFVFSSPIFLKIGSLETDILESLAIHLVKVGVVKIGGVLCRFASIEVEMPKEFKGSVIVKAISPITVYRTLYAKDGSKKTYFFNPWESEFSELVLNNLKRKAKAYFGNTPLPPFEGSYIKPVEVSKKDEVIVRFKGIWIKGWLGRYEIKLPKPYFDIGYNAGFGSKNSQGFGMVEVVE